MAKYDFVISPKGDEFCEDLAEILKAPYAPYNNRRFMDKEVCPRYLEKPELEGKSVLITSRTQSGVNFDANAYLMELVLMARFLKSKGVLKIHGLLPYLPYARQDKEFEDGEAVNAKEIVALLNQVGLERIYTVCPHMSPIENGFLEYFGGEVVYGISVWKEIADYIKNANRFKMLMSQNPLVIGPDLKAGGAAEIVSKALDLEYDSIEKKRDRNLDDTLEMRDQLPDLKGRSVIFIDDIAGSGGTLERAIKRVKEIGATEAVAIVVHPVCAGACNDRVNNTGAKFYATNTIMSFISRVHVEERVAREIKKAP